MLHESKFLPQVTMKLCKKFCGGRNPSTHQTHAPGFELAVCNLRFAKHFGSLQMSFCIVSKNCESLESDTSWIFRVIDWTSHIVSHFKPIKYPLLNTNVILQRFIVHINFKLHTTFFSNYHFVTILQIVSSW